MTAPETAPADEPVGPFGPADSGVDDVEAVTMLAEEDPPATTGVEVADVSENVEWPSFWLLLAAGETSEGTFDPIGGRALEMRVETAGKAGESSVSLVTDDIEAEVEAVTRDVVCPEAAGPDDEDDGPLFTGGSG